jgi:hypothetical protein
LDNTKNKEFSEKSNVLTVRISQQLDQVLENLKDKKGISKATLIRNYLEMAKYILVDQGSIKSINDRELIIIKRKTFKKMVKGFSEVDQMNQGIKFAQFINDLAQLKGKIDDIEYKLELCEHLGFFPKLIDGEKYVLFSNKFGPKKFVEAFVYKLINHDADNTYNLEYTEDNIENKRAIKQEYNKMIQPLERSSSYYAYEFAKIQEKE